MNRIRKGEKLPRPQVESLDTGAYIHEVSAGQMFYETPRTWELWQEEPLRFLRRWRKFYVLEVNEAK